MVVSLTKAAEAIGVSERWLRAWASGSGKCKPALPCKGDGRRRLVDPVAAYEHIKRHAAKRPPGFRAPAGYAPAEREAVDLSTLDLPADPREFMAAVFKRPELLTTLTPEQLKTAKAFAAELRLGESAAARQEAKLSPEDVTKMLRSFVELIVAVVEEQVEPDAAELVRRVRAEFSVDLVETNSAALAILDAYLRERANVTIEAVQKHLYEKCDALRLLEAIAQ